MNLELELKRFIRRIRPGLIGATSNPNVNLSQLIDDLKIDPTLLNELRGNLRDFLITRDFTAALTETGLTLETGAFSELLKRFEYKLLPKPLDHLDVLSFLRQVFDGQSDLSWLEEVDRESFAELLGLLLPQHQELVEPLAPQLFMSLEILSLRLAGMGYDPVVTKRLKARREYQHAFMEVSRQVHILLDKGEVAIPALRDALERCAQAVRWVRARRTAEGVSLGLTHRLLKIQQIVDRMQLLLKLLETILKDWDPKPSLELFFEIVLSELRRFELRPFLASNLQLLAFQITEHTGRTGEHYITRTRADWLRMFRSAAIGGAVVAVLALLKLLASKLSLPPGPEALTYGLIYATGFVFLHSIGATLATKQPAMTASHLASLMDEATDSHSAMEKLADIIVRTIRSQFIALVGNFTLAFPVAVLIGLPFAMAQHPLMSNEKATKLLESLHMFKSLSFFYAAVAGVCLFVSGLLAGSADNWFVFNEVGSRLRQSALLTRFVKPQNLDRVVKFIDQNLGFWVGNISLGLFLGAMPAIGQIMGLPLDIRHITFASAQAGLAMVSLNFHIEPSFAAIVGLTVLMVGLINLAVSFALTLIVVVKSRSIRFSQTPLLIRKLGRRFRARPLEFVIPPWDAT